MHVNRNEKDVEKSKSLNLNINNSRILQVDNFKYLGVHIDSELSWTVHISELCTKVSKMVSFLGRLSSFVDESQLRLLYNSVIMPHFYYGDIVWHSACKSHLEIIQKLQNRAGRIILKVKSPENKSISEIHDILKWYTLQDRTDKHIYCMMYKILNGMAPDYLKEKFTYKSINYFLRHGENLTLPKPNTQKCKRTFLYRGVKMYNDLPCDIRQSSSLAVFNKKLPYSV